MSVSDRTASSDFCFQGPSLHGRCGQRMYEFDDRLELALVSGSIRNASASKHRPSLRSGAWPKSSHLIRYYGWYSNKARGMRRKVAEAAEPADSASIGDTPEAPAPSRASQTWAMLIKRVYEIDPLCCPKCQGQMKVLAFIEPPQADVIEKILRHCGLWHCSRAPPAGGDSVHDGHGQASPDEPRS